MNRRALLVAAGAVALVAALGWRLLDASVEAEAPPAGVETAPVEAVPDDGRLVVNDLSPARVTGVSGPVHEAAFSRLGQYLAWRTADGAFLGHMGRSSVTEFVEVTDGEVLPGLAWHRDKLLVLAVARPEGPVLLRRAAKPQANAVPLLDLDRAPPPQTSPAFSHDGLVVLWASEGDVWKWDRRQDGPRRILGGPEPDAHPEVSRDDSRIVVERGPVGGRSLVVTDLEGVVLQVVSEPGADLWGADWLPGGDMVAMRSVDGRGSLVRVGAGGVVPLVADVAPGGTGAVVSELGDFLAWVPGASRSSVLLQDLEDGRRVEIVLPVQDLEVLDFAQGFGQAFLALGGRAPGEAERGLFLVEVTRFAPPPVGSGPGGP